MKAARLKRLLTTFLACPFITVGFPATASAEQAAHIPNTAPALSPIKLPTGAPAGAPNIIVVLMDDVGFAADSTFGGPVSTPNLDALAAGGLRYNRFNTTAMCSPTRASLLTGRNHHRVQMGSIVNLAFGANGYTSMIPDSAATIGDVLKANGYATGWFGKNHVTPLWEQTAAGPFNHWPSGLGFDYFYGFMDGASDQFNPIIIENRNAIDPSVGKKDYILDRDLADRAISWAGQVKDATPGKPVFIYLAPGSAHEPHQAPADWLTKFRGAFDHGYDVERERIFERQKKAGVIPANAKLTPRPEVLPAWNSLSAEQQRVSARQMEAFAAQRAFFDDQFGRLVAEFKVRGEWDNTLVIFIDGDNGSSGEGGPLGTTLGLLNRPKETLAYKSGHIDGFGGPFYTGNYSAAWGWALNAPFPWFKQHASHLGGVRAGMVVSWPKKIKPEKPGAWRNQYGHVNDIAPTIYEAIGIKPPATFEGVPQLPIDGSSLMYSFSNSAAPSAHRTQYYEMLGNVAIYKDGWLANLTPPNVMFAPESGKQKHWELFNLDQDFSQSRNLAAAHPEKLEELKAEWGRQQRKNGFVWQDAAAMPRSNAALRPDPFAGQRTVTLRPSEAPMPDGAFPDLYDRQWSLSVDVEVGQNGAEGTLISQGGFPYGWGLYLIDGRPTFLYVFEPQPAAKLATVAPLAPGKHHIEIGMTPVGEGSGGPADLHLSIDGGPRMTTRLDLTVPAYFGANGVGVGREVGTVMQPEMPKPFAFTGKMGPVRLSIF